MATRCPTVFVGPAQSGKKTLLAEQYLARSSPVATSDRIGRCVWLVPNSASVEPLRNHLATLCSGALLDPGVQTLASFADSLVKLGNEHVRPITVLQKRFLLQHALLEAEGEDRLSYFKPIAQTPGLLAQLDRWIADKKRSDVWAEDFKKSAQSKRERELGQLYGEYQRLLVTGKLYDAEGRFWAAREILGESIAQNPHQFDRVVVSGFSDFTAAQYDILQLLAKSANQFYVSISADPRETAAENPAGRGLLFRRIGRTLGRLREVIPQLQIETPSEGSVPSTQGLPPSLCHAEQTLFSDPEQIQTDKVPPPQAIEILAAGSQQQEIELVAGRIKEKLLAGLAQPGDVVIVSPSLYSDSQRIGRVLEDHGIPYRTEQRRPLADSGLAQSLRDVLQLEVEDWPFRRLLAVVCNRELPHFDAPAGMQPRVCLEQAIRAAQLPSGKKRLLQQLERWSEDTSAEKSDAVRQATVAHGLLLDLAQFLDALPSTAPLSEWVEAVEKLLQALGALKNRKSDDAWGILRQSLNSLTEVEDWALQENAPVALAQFLKYLQLATSNTALPGSFDAVGRVRVLTAETARHLSVPDVFLVGVTEQAFSASQAVNPLEASGQRTTSQLADDQSDVMYLFYTLVTRAKRSLTLSYPAFDDKAQQLPPSPLLTELRRCFPGLEIPTQTQQPGQTASDESVPYSRTALRVGAVRNAVEKRPQWLAGLVAQPVPTGRNILSGIGAVASRAKRDQFGPFEGICTSEQAAALLKSAFNENHLWSPSQLEEYGRCPFRFFAAQVLGLQEQADITVANNMGRRGSLLHQVLAAVHQQLAEKPLESEDDQHWREQLVERFRQALDKEIESRPLGGIEQSLREIERREIDAWAENYAKQEFNYRQRWSDLDQPPQPTYFEVRFGPEVAASDQSEQSPLSTPLPFELDLGQQQIRITGQIDRIDVGRVGNVAVFNVIDYKSGKEVKFKPAELLAGKQLQLPLYALAAEEVLLSGQNAEALAAGYWSIQGKGFEAGALELQSAEGATLKRQPSAESLREQLVETLGRIVGDIQQGKFPVYNSEEKCTGWCEYRTICRIGQIRSLEKQWPQDEAPSP